MGEFVTAISRLVMAPRRRRTGGPLPDWHGSPESPEDGQIRCGDAVDAQPHQLVEALAVVDRPRQDQQLVLVQPGDQVRIYQALKCRYAANRLPQRGVRL